ncbi:4Fe-4S dicluster domain-containing protein [Ferrimonas balearica]|uniref:4Fe-4S dicluster domain-containing protein n=1 Tax=Ferrimonas balearica TaxID=44012 RepID=UPI001C994A59|nr:4Fe-4S dicluster domain-containing protein [Ferrimonas balearica]MBY5993583.1 4Fe-4S dicluster domain-containing protein [Ferrimonas balearica]
MSLSRREFLVTGSLAIPVLTLTGCGAQASSEGRNLALAFDQRRCIGCEACVQACRQTNDVPEGVTRLNIVRTGPFGEGEETHYRFDRESCVHCETAACIAVCPTGACFRDEDGVVDVVANKCVGCQYCIAACPYRVRYVDPVTKAVDKCDLCRKTRLSAGLPPACVEACPTKALTFGDLNDPNSDIVNLLRAHQTYRDKVDLGTRPKLYKVPHGRGEVI